MTILLTGAGGFVGRRVLRNLLASGAGVTAIDRAACPIKFPQSGLTWIEGDLCDDECLARAFADPPSSVIHLASVPGGAAEANPALSFEVNVTASIKLAQRAAAVRQGMPFVFASSIAVLGSDLPSEGVDDGTELRPDLVYGGHKLMVEQALAMMARRGEVKSISLRLPGIVPRPAAPSGLKSAFLSDIFHAIREGSSISVPVGPDSHSWLISVSRCAACIVYGASISDEDLPESRALTIPSLRVQFEELVEEISRQVDGNPNLVNYSPDPRIESSFGRYPELKTPAADILGFRHDGDLRQLVEHALYDCDTTQLAQSRIM